MYTYAFSSTYINCKTFGIVIKTHFIIYSRIEPKVKLFHRLYFKMGIYTPTDINSKHHSATELMPNRHDFQHEHIFLVINTKRLIKKRVFQQSSTKASSLIKATDNS